MSLKNKVKDKAKQKVKKIAFKVLKPFLPFILIIGLLFFAICTIIDAIFIQEVQSDTSSLPEAQAEIRNACIEKAEYLNTCNNYVGTEKTQYLLDIDNKESDKEIQWSHLYSIMVFHNITNGKEIDPYLLDEVASNFVSKFIYEKSTIKKETKTKDKDGKESISTTEDTIYLLVESDTIMGHYKYNYNEQITEKDNVKTTQKVFSNEELLGEKYERLKKYLRNNLNVNEENIETDLQIIIQAASGYYEGEENTSWLQGNASSSEIITDGKGLIPTRYVYLANTWLYQNNISFWYANPSNYSVFINYIVELM